MREVSEKCVTSHVCVVLPDLTSIVPLAVMHQPLLPPTAHAATLCRCPGSNGVVSDLSVGTNVTRTLLEGAVMSVIDLSDRPFLLPCCIPTARLPTAPEQSLPPRSRSRPGPSPQPATRTAPTTPSRMNGYHCWRMDGMSLGVSYCTTMQTSE
jgi:hypothetical protein